MLFFFKNSHLAALIMNTVYTSVPERLSFFSGVLDASTPLYLVPRFLYHSILSVCVD